ncbi:hypothetical protein P154DRAFT_583498 [Amniculicola lignicola CBS 123094]|uniref:DUF7924 domain-containing protein n=1 Tax=Amniculicola lignicola CBS 123094 TaxID=1392246 RepID=A0A6A5W0P2_9PLEO|nr:hypothetical protein P154DRAFT_583498 [Amniculicola lignicola CBS 123094]
MNGAILKSRSRCSRVKLSKTLRDTLLDAIRETGAGADTFSKPKEQPRESRDLVREEPLQSATKRRLDTTSESDLLRVKRARLALTDVQPRAADGKVEQATETIFQQPKPLPPQHPYALFLRDFVDPVDSDPRPQAEPDHTFVYNWLMSVDSRSDSYPGDVPIARTRSAPETGYPRDVDGYVVPPTPASTVSQSHRMESESIAPSESTASGRKTALVESPGYRDFNLAQNGIYIKSSREKPPEHIANLINHMRKDRQSPGPSRDEVWEDAALEALGDGSTEAQVEKYFSTKVFPDYDPPGVLVRAERLPMFKHVTPTQRSTHHKISTPVPDLLYGYRNREAFPQQQLQLSSMESHLWVNSQRLIYPFFAIEFKGDGGSMWVATNQCIGGSTSCVDLAERLNRQLLDCQSDSVRPIDSAAFSIAMDGMQAHLYISWKHNELEYYMQEFDSFLLQKPEQYLEFRKHVRNIVDWGKDTRLKEIQRSLDTLLEESRRKASQAAKSRGPSSDDLGPGGRKRGKRSSSSKSNSRTSSAQGQY